MVRSCSRRFNAAACAAVLATPAAGVATPVADDFLGTEASALEVKKCAGGEETAPSMAAPMMAAEPMMMAEPDSAKMAADTGAADYSGGRDQGQDGQDQGQDDQGQGRGGVLGQLIKAMKYKDEDKDDDKVVKRRLEMIKSAVPNNCKKGYKNAVIGRALCIGSILNDKDEDDKDDRKEINKIINKLGFENGNGKCKLTGKKQDWYDEQCEGDAPVVPGKKKNKRYPVDPEDGDASVNTE